MPSASQIASGCSGGAQHGQGRAQPGDGGCVVRHAHNALARGHRQQCDTWSQHQVASSSSSRGWFTRFNGGASPAGTSIMRLMPASSCGARTQAASCTAACCLAVSPASAAARAARVGAAATARRSAQRNQGVHVLILPLHAAASYLVSADAPPLPLRLVHVRAHPLGRGAGVDRAVLQHRHPLARPSRWLRAVDAHHASKLRLRHS